MLAVIKKGLLYLKDKFALIFSILVLLAVKPKGKHLANMQATIILLLVIGIVYLLILIIDKVKRKDNSASLTIN